MTQQFFERPILSSPYDYPSRSTILFHVAKYLLYRKYRDHGNPLKLIVEINGYRGENAKEKVNAIRAYWVPAVNNLGKFVRWAFAEFTEVFEIEDEFNKLIDSRVTAQAVWEA